MKSVRGKGLKDATIEHLRAIELIKTPKAPIVIVSSNIQQAECRVDAQVPKELTQADTFFSQQVGTFGRLGRKAAFGSAKYFALH